MVRGPGPGKEGSLRAGSRTRATFLLVGTAAGAVSSLALEAGSEGLEPTLLFLRGDGNADGKVDFQDAVHILRHLFSGDRALQCPKASDLNDDGEINLTDAVCLIEFLFRGGNLPAYPYPQCGIDPTSDGLSCGLEACSR